MKIKKDFNSKLKRIASVKRRKSAEKQTRGIGPKNVVDKF